MRALLMIGVLVLAGCSPELFAASERRKAMNDTQARITIEAVCDISVGAALRELNAVERQYVMAVCGDLQAASDVLVRLQAGGQ